MLPILLLSLVSCVTKQEKLASLYSDYCLLYEPFPTKVELDITKAWDIQEATIISKINGGLALTGTEKLLILFIDYTARNNEKFYKKGCDSDN